MNNVMKKIIIVCTRMIPDRLYLKIMYRFVTKKKLHLNNPESFNEKLQWLKLYYRRSEFANMVDKYEMKNYVTSKLGAGYVVPCIGVWNSVDEIDFNLLPEKFVLKCTHDSHGIVICKDKSLLDYDNAKKKLKEALKRKYYLLGREWVYKNVVPRIIAEEYLEDENSNQLSDYKVYNFNGEPRLIQVDFDRFKDHKRQFFNEKWEGLSISWDIPSFYEYRYQKPIEFEKMLDISRKLSKGFPHLRTDFYICNGRLYVGELTFYSGNGMGKWTPESFDITMGNWLVLPHKE